MSHDFARSNLLPYLLILAGIIWYQWNQNQTLQEANDLLEKRNVEIYEMMGAIQAANEERFEHLSEVRKRKWKAGKHSAKF